MCKIGLQMIYGYARVSTDGQSLDAQLAELRVAGCQKVFQEKISGARSDRRELARVMTKLGKGDTLVICRLDRLARSSRDLLNLLHDIGLKGAKFRSIRDQGRHLDPARATNADSIGGTCRVRT